MKDSSLPWSIWKRTRASAGAGAPGRARRAGEDSPRSAAACPLKAETRFSGNAPPASAVDRRSPRRRPRSGRTPGRPGARGGQRRAPVVRISSRSLVVRRVRHDRTRAWFFAAARIIAGPPTSIISIVLGPAPPRRDRLLEGIQLTTTRSKARSRPLAGRARGLRGSVPSTPPKIFGWSVLTRPPRISGNPVVSSTRDDLDPGLLQVPPCRPSRRP